MGKLIVKDLFKLRKKKSSSSKPSVLHERSPHESSSSPITKLSEDILFDIFLRLGQGSIRRCKAVSKVWRSVISNPVFINKWFAKYTSMPNLYAWGLGYGTHDLLKKNKNVVRKKNIVTDTLASTAAPCHTRCVFNEKGINVEFIHGSVTFKENQFRLGISYGLCLCQVTKSSGLKVTTNRFWSQIYGVAFSKNSWGYNQQLRYYHKKYYVINHHTNKMISIPRPSDKWIAGHSIYSGPSTEHASFYSTKFVRIPQIWIPSKEFDIEIYSSDTGAWEVRRVSCPRGTTITIKTLTSLDIVVHNRVLYWINGENRAEVRTIDLRNYKGSDGFHQYCKALCLPVEYDRDGCLGAQLDGHLCYCSVRNHELNLWELRFIEEKWDWCLVQKDIDISNISNYYNYKPAALNPLDRDIVLLRNYNLWNDFLVYNIKTRTVIKIFKDSLQSWGRPK